jgi:uncharacterized damage-inducible protein DinB
MDGHLAASHLKKERHYLMNVVNAFKPEHADFRPVEGMMSVAQMIHHIAYTITWFRVGAFGEGFDMDFAKMEEENSKKRTLKEALDALNAAYDEFEAFLEPLSEAEIFAPMADNPLFGAAPRIAALSSNTDHTAHHRGALTVYLRLLGVQPVMVYAD